MENLLRQILSNQDFKRYKRLEQKEQQEILEALKQAVGLI